MGSTMELQKRRVKVQRIFSSWDYHRQVRQRSYNITCKFSKASCFYNFIIQYFCRSNLRFLFTFLFLINLIISTVLSLIFLFLLLWFLHFILLHIIQFIIWHIESHFTEDITLGTKGLIKMLAYFFASLSYQNSSATSFFPDALQRAMSLQLMMKHFCPLTVKDMFSLLSLQ